MAPARAVTGTAGHHTRPHLVINQTGDTLMTTKTTAASNGSTDITAAGATGQKDKPFGMAKVRDAETYHTANIVRQAATEADMLCAEVQHAVSDAYFGDVRAASSQDTGLTATQTAESPPVQAKLQEALNCLQAAQDYVRRLLVSTYEPPF
jgi:hypothetical protein